MAKKKRSEGGKRADGKRATSRSSKSPGQRASARAARPPAKKRARTRTIRQVVVFDADPARVYEILMTSEGHSVLTGSDARVSPVVGGEIEAWDGYITGENLELEHGKRIVQRVRFAEEEWPERHDSLATFILEPAPGGGTRLTFLHEDVPVACADDIEQGWEEHYWVPLRALLARK